MTDVLERLRKCSMLGVHGSDLPLEPYHSAAEEIERLREIERASNECVEEADHLSSCDCMNRQEELPCSCSLPALVAALAKGES